MHEMHTIVIDDRGVSMSVCLSVTRLNVAARAVCEAHTLQFLLIIMASYFIYGIKHVTKL